MYWNTAGAKLINEEDKFKLDANISIKKFER